MVSKKDKLKIIPLGGLGEIGKNMTAIEYEDEILIIDCGLSFPEEEMLGVDIVIPDITYLIKNKEKVKGIVITHGHEDHIGALPYFLKKINVPVYGSRLAVGLIENKLKGFKMKNAHIERVEPRQKVQLGAFNVEFISTSHSIPDAFALSVETPAGIVFHTGDFRIDYTPIDGQIIDLDKIAEIGRKGVLVMLADSTNAERPGTTRSEKSVGDTFNEIFSTRKSRIIIATFASHVHRIQQIVNSCVKYNRKIVFAGRSMLTVGAVAQELGVLNIPEGITITEKEMDKYPDEEVVVVVTGSQGEPMAALPRMASDDHRTLDIRKGDTVVFSSTPIPGNEKLVGKVMNLLYDRGAEVIYDKLYDIHTSGHACQEELKLMHRLVRPQYFIPVHGEVRHLRQHGLLAEELGMPKENIFVGETGDIMEFSKESAKVIGKVTAGQVLVDGLGVGDVGNIVLRDRKHLAEDGLMIVVVTIKRENRKVMAGPDIISRGFVYVRESETLMAEAKEVVTKALESCEKQNAKEWSVIKGAIRDQLKGFLYEKTKRRPMILPIIMEV